MDSSRFDALTRALAGARAAAETGSSRRGFLAGLAALAAGVAGARTAVGQTGCPPGQVNRRGLGCVCRATGRPPGPMGCPCLADAECPASAPFCVNTTCRFGLGAACVEADQCVSDTCCPAGAQRAGLCGIPTGETCPQSSGQPNNNACCSGSCFDFGGDTGYRCRERQPAGAACDVGDIADCLPGLACCISDGSSTGFACCQSGQICDTSTNRCCTPGVNCS